MFAAAITNINTLYGTSYFTGSLGNPGASITVDFVEQTHQQALDKAMTFLDTSWRWRVTPAGVIELAQYADSSATHQFVLGRDIESIEVTRTIMDVKNGVRVVYAGPAYAFSNDAASETAYGKRQKKMGDTNIGNVGSATALGDGEVSKLKDVKIQTMVTVNAQYNLETIFPGDTCRIVNVNDSTSQMVQGIFRILRVEYDGTRATLHLAEIVRNFGVEFARAIE